MSKANCTYKFQTINGPVTIQGMANMKAWLAVNGVEAITRDNGPMPRPKVVSRKEVVEQAKALGLPAVGSTEEIANRVAIIQADPRMWTEQDLRDIAPYLSIHQDLTPGDTAARVQSIMDRGLDRGMVSPLTAYVEGMSSRSPLTLKDGNAYVFISRKLQYEGDSPNLAPGNKPLFVINTVRGQSIAEALKTAERGAEMAKDQTQTEAFRRWFGDSKVVDAEGKPLVVYHGTNRSDRNAAGGDSSNRVLGVDAVLLRRSGDTAIAAFDPSTQTSGLAGSEDGFFFTDDTDAAGRYANMRGADGAYVLPVYLSIKNPLIADFGSTPNTTAPGPWRVAMFKEAQKNGHDGIVFKNMPDVGGDATQYVAFRPEQIKSAIGNNGDFDAGNPDIRFRSVREAVAGTVNDFRDVALPAGYRLNDILQSAPNKLDWWSKTVGTQYNLAQRSRAYKRVFDGAQEFLSDVSFYANEAANLAPTILPKLETLSDITKKPISAEDSKAISRPIFEGTLVWGRDPSTGQAVKMEVLEARAAQLDTQAKGQELIRRNLLDPKVLRMWQGMELDRYTALVENKYANEVLKPGTTFSDKELRELFKLNDGQIKLYREFRKAVNKSLSDLAVTDMVRFGGKDVAAVRDLALAAPSVRSAAKLLRDHLLEMADADPARRDVLVDTGNAMLDKAERAVELMDQGYAPLMRFGQYTVDVLDESGERVYFGMFETAREANKMARKMQENYPGGQVVQGTLSQEEYKLFAGVSPETVELFGNLLGLESSGDGASDAAFQEFLKKVKANRSAMKRLIHRKGIAGFNEDPGRVLAGFLYSNARQASSNVHMGALTEAVNDIPKTQGELKDHAVKLRDYVMNPQEEAQALRSVLFAQYLGGSVASALLNALQPVQVTFPWLSQFGGAAKAAKQMSAAIKDVMTKAKLEDRLAKALHRAEEEGIVSPQEIHQLQAQAAGRAALVGGDGTRAGDLLAAGNNALSRVSLAWGKLFGVAEQFNRRTTFIAAYRTAVDQGMTDPAEFAKRAVQETQFVYNKGNKPRWARGAIGATLFTFKQYSVSYVELMHRMWSTGGADGKKAALLGLAVLFLMSGADGLPFAEDVQDLIDGALQRMGYNASVRKAKEQFFIDLLGEGGAQFMERGLSGLPGSPVDVSGRMGLGNLIPGTGALYRKDNYSRDALEVLGPAGDLLGRAAQAGEKALKGEVLGARGALMTISPLASQNLGKAYEMYSTGMYLDRGGKKVLDTDGMDAFWKSIGIQPAGVSRIQKAGFEVQKGVAFNRLSESEIADKWARGVFLGDAELVSQARADLAEWNEKNPDMPIRIKPNQIAQRVKQMRMSKDERIAKSAPSEIRARVREELEGAR